MAAKGRSRRAREGEGGEAGGAAEMVGVGSERDERRVGDAPGRVGERWERRGSIWRRYLWYFFRELHIISHITTRSNETISYR